MEKKKALIIAYNDLNNSGVPNVIYQIIKSMFKEYDFDVMIFGKDVYYYDKLNKEGFDNITLIKIANKQFKNKLSNLIWKILFKKNYYKKIIKNILKNKNYDLLHSFHEHKSWIFLKEAYKNKIKKRIIHCAVIHEKEHNPLLRVLDFFDKKRTLKYANVFLGDSIECCKREFGGSNFTVLYNSYNEDKFNFNIQNKIDNKLVITQIATFSSNKNQLFSLDVINELSSLNDNIELRLIGVEREQSYLEKMKEKIENLHLKNIVKIIDGKRGVENCLQDTTYCILPSLKEGGPITAVEVQACGIKMFVSTGIPKDMNCGGLIYLDLAIGAKLWANQIEENFEKDHGKRTIFDMKKFSTKEFTNNLKRIYKN